MSEDEASLIGAAKSGDKSSFEALIRPHQTALYRLALSVTANVDDAEDVFQETVVQVYRAINKFRGESSFSTWLYRIALNAGRNWVRSQCRAASERYINKSAAFAVEYFSSPEDDLITREQRHLVQKALISLPDHYRDAIVLRHYENLSYEQIASILGVPVGTVRSRLAEGRKRLLEALSMDTYPVSQNRR